MGFVIHWHESAMDLHVLPIPIPPPTLQYPCLENPPGQRSLAGYSPWGLEESDRRVRHDWATKQRTKWKYKYCVWKTSMCKWIGAVQTCVVQGSAVFDRQFLPKMRRRDNMKGDSWYWHGPCLVLTRAGRAFLIMPWSFSSVCPLTGLILCRQARVTLKPVIRPVKDVACHPGCILCLQIAISDSTYKFMNLVEPKRTLWVVYVTCRFSKVVLIFVTVPKSGQKGLNIWWVNNKTLIRFTRMWIPLFPVFSTSLCTTLLPQIIIKWMNSYTHSVNICYLLKDARV